MGWHSAPARGQLCALIRSGRAHKPCLVKETGELSFPRPVRQGSYFLHLCKIEMMSAYQKIERFWGLEYIRSVVQPRSVWFQNSPIPLPGDPIPMSSAGPCFSPAPSDR